MTDSPPDADWTAVRALFEACLELSAEERTGRLAAAPADVRREVADLLREHEQGEGRLQADDCHRAFVNATTDVVGVGGRVGRYRILDVLGRGGMGTVYLAEQETPHRRVALKLLTSAVVGEEATQRFRLEAELLGRLRHQGIAQVYEASVHEEQMQLGTMQWPFFAMEYVEDAVTLSEWSAERARSEGEVLEVFLQICAAVQHAHERGVVHRDLKPQNVLVDPDGNAKIIDFGIARTLDQDSGLTQTGELVGTLRYMAPEQIRGDSLSIDTRTDVHALGVMLFEMLAGELPFDLKDKSLPDVGQAICDADARPLRQLQPHAAVDLELVLMKALAKEPSRRYAQAGSIAEELQRYLRREPISARPPSLRYQLGMFARRRRGLVVAALLIVMTSTIGGVTSLMYALRAQEAEQLARQEGDQKTAAMRRVFDNAMRSILNLPRRLAGLPGVTELRREVVEEAVAQLRYVEDNVPLDQAMRYSLAVAYRDLGRIQGARMHGNVGDRERAEVSLQRARDYLEALLAEEPGHVGALFLAFDVEVESGAMAFAQSRRSEDSVRRWKSAGRWIERVASRVPEDEPRLLDARSVYAQHQADVLMVERDVDGALRLFDVARDLLCKSFPADGPSDLERTRLGLIYRSIAVAHESRRDGVAAVKAYEQAIEALAFIEDRPKDRQTRSIYAMIRSQYGYSLASQGRGEEGERNMRWGYDELGRLHSTDEANASLAGSFGMACQRLAEHLAITAKYEQQSTAARKLNEEALAIATRGKELAEPLLERSRDMVTMLVVGECKRIIALCEQRLR